MSAGVGTDGSKKWRMGYILPIDALCKKASMGAAYAADPSCFLCSFKSEKLQDRAVE